MTLLYQEVRPRYTSSNFWFCGQSIAHLSEAKRRECLLELIEVFMEAAEEDSSDTHRQCQAVLEKYEVEVEPV